jgi:hypothetical protein
LRKEERLRVRENILETSKNLDKPIYALDDNSAILIEDDKMEII